MKKRLKAVCLIMSLVMLLSGCTIGGKEVYFSFQMPGTVFTICGMSCSAKETKVYLANYKNLYGRVGNTDLWDGNFNSETLEVGLKQSVINHLSTIYSLNVYADDNGIELEDNEKEKASAAAKEYKESLTDKDKKYLGVSASDIRSYYERYMLASKVYDELMSMVDSEVSEDEARIMDAYVLYVTEADVAEQMKSMLAAGTPISTLAATYSKDAKDLTSFGRGTYSDEVESVAFSLEDGEVSDCITTDEGYYFIECVDKYNEDLSEENKTKIVEKRKSDVFTEIIEEQKKNGRSEVNKSQWDNMHIVDGEGITTDKFFTIIESYL